MCRAPARPSTKKPELYCSLPRSCRRNLPQTTTEPRNPTKQQGRQAPHVARRRAPWRLLPDHPPLPQQQQPALAARPRSLLGRGLPLPFAESLAADGGPAPLGISSPPGGALAGGKPRVRRGQLPGARGVTGAAVPQDVGPTRGAFVRRRWPGPLVACHAWHELALFHGLHFPLRLPACLSVCLSLGSWLFSFSPALVVIPSARNLALI